MTSSQDFYTTVQESKDAKYRSRQTSNPRYPNFKQNYFTAGDIDQFYSNKDPSNGKQPNPTVDLSKNAWSSHTPDNIDWEKYKNITSEAVDNTFRYLFEKFKKGVFIKIKNNQLAVFLPFSKHNYINEWSNRIKFDPSLFSSMNEFLMYASKLQGYTIRPDQINKFVNSWYANNCLVRYEFPIGENDRGLSNLKDMLETLCNTRVVPDIECFINKRDFPVIKRDDTEPYEHMFDSEKFPLLSHRYKSYCPILSTVTTDVNADIPFPTAEDWARVSSQEDKKFFEANPRDYSYDFSKKWSERVPIAVFRGATTGCGVTTDTNVRLKLAEMSLTSPVEKGYPLLDAGITAWNTRPRKIMGEPYLKTIEPAKFPFKMVPALTPEEQSKYKYVINVDGHVSAFRLSLEMSMGSVILLVESKYRMWFRKFLQPFVHYVPVKADLSDLYEKIRWCRDHDEECLQIIENAKKFYRTYLTKDGILDYIQFLFLSIKRVTGIYFYNTLKIEDIIYSIQQPVLDEEQMFVDETFDPKNTINFINPKRHYPSMEGLQLFIRQQKDILLKNVKNITVLQETENTKVYKSKVGHVTLLFKESKTGKDKLLNEAFCGIMEINKLVKIIPHFSYTYYLSSKGVLVSEYIEGETFKEFMTKCTLQQYLQILVMIFMALSVAQEKCGFVHYDLYPWNIMITKCKKQTITYQFKDNIFTITTDIIPVIIDYGRTHVIHKNQHYGDGTLHPFKTSLVQDSFCLVISSVYEMLQRFQYSANDVKKLIYLTNFFSPNKMTTVFELKEFLTINKKYNEMVFGNKCSLETKTPLQVFFYLLENPLFEKEILNFTAQINYPQKVPYDIQQTNPLFYYDIITGKNPLRDIYDYVNKLESNYDFFLAEAENVLQYVNVCNLFTLSARDVKQFVSQLVEDKTNEQQENKENVVWMPSPITIKKIQYMCDRLLGRIESKYEIYVLFAQKADEKSRVIDTGYINPSDQFRLASYQPSTFSIPERMLTILQGQNDRKDNYLIDLEEMFIFNVFYNMPYKIPDEETFCKTYAKVFTVSPLTIMNNNANINTARRISQQVYEKDIEEFKTIPNMPQKTLRVLHSIMNVL